ncbi:pyridoxal phosphate-dependent aminotransferase [Photobacterium rosenbergii]|uniref:Pyridoxal phosphate-dependent aminotransferase n=1 Tax=Photobacterium rosenbergii TaxID=294936 RepID=A0A2T3NDJ1_9GAMM|nr:aminotransferase class I/II-fold pyridoxal phosphate-dependent enzyme [Photobacterium rosenbergii]PSW12209.1 pyridoxal phosphate-dependent aminotransferase [Photobacterium rosenbergii]
MKLNRELEKEQASYVTPMYTIDCELGSNPFGAPSISPDQMLEILDEINDYYSFSNLAQLSHLVGLYLGISSDDLTFTTGSLGALELIFNKLIDQTQKTMLGIGPQFVEGVSEFQLVGGQYQALNMFAFNCDSDLFGALENKILRERPTLVYIDNPNNPTGRIYRKEHLLSLCEVCKEAGSLLIIDEAYGEFLTPEQSMVKECQHHSHLMVLRTFSKGLGLAGIRLGYVVSSPKLTPYVQSAVSVFTPSLPALKIACHVLPRANDFVTGNQTKTIAFKRAVMDIFHTHGFNIVPTSEQTPILLVHKPGVDMAEVLRQLRILSCAGQHFQITNPDINEEYARLRIVGNDRDLHQLSVRLKSLV